MLLAIYNLIICICFTVVFFVNRAKIRVPSFRIIFVLISFFLLINMLDVHSTWLAINRFGPNAEAGFFIRFLFTHVKIPPIQAVILIKIIVIPPALSTLVFLIADKRVLFNILMSTNIVLSLVVVSNYIQYLAT